MEKNTKKGPLLYVSQTFLNTPVKNNQEVFTNRQEVRLPIEEPQLEVDRDKKKVFEVSLAKTELPNESKLKEVKEENKAQKNQEKQRTFNRVKGFKEMKLIERLEYLANFPKALPSVPCVFITKEKNYQGYLVEYNDQDITIRIPNQETETIQIKDLTNIMMIGIKR
ncbi:CotO family spore coat protein [Bacillus sp. OK048]|uniref:CotO family spore coat protein n=1 Tax=Bacillus sp. OK048 TaxID=1882761 RepID=UPI0008813295|nr:CotO family spore coat protein [Bacillus sp. OK048]SDN15091.1 Spore coat protein CotO [Bacillus sp. OK048]